MEERCLDFEATNHAALAALLTLLARWLPGGRRSGSEYVVRNPTRADRKPGSFSVNLYNGKWADFATGDKGGDAISLYAYLEGLTQGDAARRLAEDLDLDQTGPRQQRFKRRRAAPTRGHRAMDDETRQRIAAARELWRRARPAAGTVIEIYLQIRGITMVTPPTIRYAPDLKHGPTGMLLPGMVAAVQAPDRTVTGVHRTYLREDGKVKASITTPKMMLGSCSGGAVRLAAAGATLAIAEGIETSLAIQQATGLPAWAALSTSGIRAVVLPAQVREVVICPDGDEPGEAAAKVAAERFIREGRAVRIAPAPKGRDYNDLVKTKGMS